MNRVKITADGLLQIVTGLFDKCDYTIDDKLSALDGKRMTEVLNIEYYTFKKRLQPASDYIESMEKSLQRSFCLVELTNVERLYSKDLDYVSVDGKLTLWLQSYKVKLLESFIETCNRALCGERVDVTVDKQKRSAAVFFGAVNVLSADAHSEIGESQVCEIGVSMILTQDITSYSDYAVEIGVPDDAGVAYTAVPITAMNTTSNMTAKSAPYVNAPTNTGTVNLSKVKMVNLVFYAFNEPVVDRLTNLLYADVNAPENNTTFVLRITRRDKTYTFNTVVSNISNELEQGTGHEILSVSFAVKGKRG